jgi:hypothetical protein
MQKGRRCAGAIGAIAVGFILITGSAYGYGLLDEDLVYLKTVQQLEPYDAPILDLSPKERSHLHDLINDPRSVDELYARDKNGTVSQPPALGESEPRPNVGCAGLEISAIGRRALIPGPWTRGIQTTK